MIAGLLIYERPELFEAHNRFWQIVHEQIGGSSKILSRLYYPMGLVDICKNEFLKVRSLHCLNISS